MKKRKLSIMLTTLLVASTALYGCGSVSNSSSSSSSGNAKSVTINYWNPFTGDDGKTMSKIVDAFNTEEKGKITVKVQSMTADDMYSKLTVAEQSGTGIPDVCINHIDRIPYYASRNMLKPMDDIIKKMGLSKSDFIAKTWDGGVQPDGKRYSLPLDTHPWVMFYNKKMLTDLGYTEADLKGLTGDKFLEMCKKATKGDKFGIGLAWSWMTPTFYSLLGQYGGTLVTTQEPGKAKFNGDEGVKAAEQIKAIVDAKVTNKAGSDHVALFKQGKSLFCVDGIWSSTGMNAVQGLQWGEMFLPQFGSQPCEWANSHNLVIPKQPKEDSAKLNADITFIKYLSDHSLDWAKGGQVPARLSVLNSAEFKALPWGFAADHLDAFSYPAPVTTSGDMQNALGGPLPDIFTGKVDVKKGLDKAAKDAEAHAAQTLGK